MISIIVCSIKPDLLKNFKANVLETIGVPFEFVIIDNNKERFSICKAYNIGASKAKYELLAFCHEDILFHTDNWGKELLNFLNTTDIGLVGIAGATFKSKYPTSWISVPKELYRTNLYIETNKETKKNKPFDDVVVLDGCFLGVRRKIWKKFQFNEDLLKGFHLYDIDFSLRIQEHFRVIVANTFSISHLSEGNLDKNWFEESKKFHDYYKNKLPRSLESEIKSTYLNDYGLRSLIYRSRKLELPFSQKLNMFLKLVNSNPSMLTLNLLKALK